MRRIALIAKQSERTVQFGYQRVNNVELGTEIAVESTEVLPIVAVRAKLIADVGRTSQGALMAIRNTGARQRLRQPRLRETLLPRQWKLSNIEHSIDAQANQRFDEIAQYRALVADGVEGANHQGHYTDDSGRRA